MQMAEIALMSAVLCVLAPVAVPLPFSPVPLTLATLAVYLAAALLGPKKGTISVLLYLLAGMAGLPVFSGFSGGIGRLAGPTGGYVIGYLPCALLVGWLVEYKQVRKGWQFVWNGLAMGLGTIICYGIGTAWFLRVMNGTYTPAQALTVCVLPYLAFDGIKVILASVLVVPVRKLLRRMELL